MDTQKFYKEFANQAEKMGLSVLLAGFSLYLDKEIDELNDLLKADGTSLGVLEKFWADKKQRLLEIENQIDKALDVVTKEEIKKC